MIPDLSQFVDQKNVNIFWFRRDLRLEDNHALSRALQAGEKVLPIFVFDRNILAGLDESDKRVVFIYQSLMALNEQLGKWSSGLWTFYGTPLEAFAYLADRLSIHRVFVNRDYEPDAVSRDKRVADLLVGRGIHFSSFRDQVIFEGDDVLTQMGKPYTVFTPYKKKWLATLDGDPPSYPVAEFASQFVYFKMNCELIKRANFGFSDSVSEIPSPEFSELLRDYDRLRDFPGRAATSRLGVHLRFGSLGIRQAVREARRLNETWLSQLIWRDFYMQILHHFPYVTKNAFKPAYDRIAWRDAPMEFERWCHGQTGVPIVDAGMRELNETGFMHNRVRMITASFLCKHLLIDWRRGEAYFARKLLDFDLAANNGNWQWAAGTGCDAAPYFRIFNPWIQANKFDKAGDYIKRYLPEFESPDYPAPMVDHKLARQRALQTYKNALDN